MTRIKIMSPLLALWARILQVAFWPFWFFGFAFGRIVRGFNVGRDLGA